MTPAPEPMDPQAPSAAIAQIADGWGLTLAGPAGSRYSETWFARRGDEHVVLKVGDPLARRREAAALRAYGGGRGAPVCLLLEHDEQRGALLLERVLLGDDLRPLARRDDDAATALAASLMVELQGAAGVTGAARAAGARLGLDTAGGGAWDELPHLSMLAATFERYWRGPEHPLPPALVRSAERLALELTAPAAADAALHGDLNHGNILRAGLGDAADRWRAIDPHGWVGDPVFDAAAFLLNPTDVLADHPTPARLVRRRARILAEGTGWDYERLLAWAFVGAVVSELWCWEDHGLIAGGPLRLATQLHH